jgi:peptidoglycan-associated lipoprotein
MSAAAVLSGCATTGALRRATQQQQTAIAQQQTALNNERAERVAADSALSQNLGMVRGDVQSLRTDLQSMKTDFGAKISMLEDGLHFALPVNFAFNDATVRQEDTTSLGRFAHVVQTYYPGSRVTIEGFADPAGSARYNINLSQRRASAVREYLVSRGLTTTDLNTVGYGKTRLVAPGAWGDMPGADLNRRVVFVIESRGTTGVAMVPATDSTQQP